MWKRLFLTAMILILLATSCAQSSVSSIERKIQRVENGLIREYRDPLWERMTLAERMEYYNVPGVSIAVINDFEVEWVKGYGASEAGGNKPVTPDTLFQAASIGKPVVAVAALHYVEAELLDLGENVNERLISWHVTENEFTAQEKVTLRRLLSHSAGVTVSGFGGYAQGEEIPILQQILDGEPPANSPPIRVDIVPGTQHRYSGGGYMIVQQLLMDVTGKPFPEIMQETVLRPSGMISSTFEYPLPKEREDAAATGHRANGQPLKGKWHTYPEMGAGASLWTTPSDLARFAIEIMLSYAEQSSEVLSQDMANQMLAPQIDDRGLGPVMGDDGGDLLYFMHPGGNEGFRCVLVAYPKRGQGVVIMTNGDSGEALWREILNSVSVAYGWVRDYTNVYLSISIGVMVIVVGMLLLRRIKPKLT